MKHETLDPGFKTPTDWSMGTPGTGTVKSGFIDLNPIWLGSSTTTTHTLNSWSTPELTETNVLESSIELIYKQNSLMNIGWNPTPYRIFKIVFSCIDGKWNKSEPIYGEIVPAQKEYYTFDYEN